MYTRILIPLLIGLLFCATSLHAQDTLVVSERVGKVIDVREHRYFQLFPTLSLSGDIVILDEGNDAITVLADGGGALHLDRAQYELLGAYLDNYEALYRSARMDDSLYALNARYNTLVQHWIVRPMQQWQGRVLQVFHRSINGGLDTLRGELLWADDNELVFRREFTSLDAEPVRVESANIVAIELYEKDPGHGALMGGIYLGALGFVFSIAAAPPEWDFADRMKATGLLTVFGVALGSALGYVATAGADGGDRRVIDNMEDYYLLLPELQQAMYYRYGLPPNSP